VKKMESEKKRVGFKKGKKGSDMEVGSDAINI
jgi:hypothetical protein